MTITDWIQAISTLVLVAVTGIYAWRTHAISKATSEQTQATKKQAEASVKMAEEMREQRIMASRPVIIQKVVVETETQFRTFGSKDWFSYFEVHNAGNGPAIELEVSLLDKEKNLLVSQRISFLKAGELPMRPDPFKSYTFDLDKREKSEYYLVSEYKSIFSGSPQPRWYQTWLPFETSGASEEGKIYVQAGELEFKEVPEKERIDAFGSRNKPK